MRRLDGRQSFHFAMGLRTCLAAGVASIALGAALASCSPASVSHDPASSKKAQGEVVCDASGHDPRVWLSDPNYTYFPYSNYPYSAVGYLDNGCTAVQIDDNHIAAAAHCFAGGLDGHWKTGLEFFPNYDPFYAVDYYGYIPRGTVTNHVVVGTRVDGKTADDWGIAEVNNWTDMGNLGFTVTPLPLAMWSSGGVSNVGYPRDDYDGNSNCGRFQPIGAESDSYATGTAPATIPPSYTNPCHVTWIRRRLDPSCEIGSDTDGYMTNNCGVSGGSSGSPLIQDTAGTYAVVGLIHGGQPGPGETGSECKVDNSYPNDGPGSEQFMYAPRFASSVTVGREPGNPYGRTAVFVADSSLNQIVYRSRDGSSYTDPFNTWYHVGAPPGTTSLGSIIAIPQPDNNTALFVAYNSYYLDRIEAQSNGFWSSWVGIGRPETGQISDLGTVGDGSGHIGLLMTQGGSAYYRARITQSNPAGWQTVAPASDAPGGFHKITGINYNYVAYAAMIDGNNDIWYTSQKSDGSWYNPTKLSRPSGVSGWRDIGMTYSEYGRGFMLATPTTQSDHLYFVKMVGSTAWNTWYYFSTRLWTPRTTVAEPAPTFLSLTTSDWAEDYGTGNVSPVIFGTDDHGDVYLVDYQRVSPVGWNLKWRSFYDRDVMYCAINGESSSASDGCCSGLTSSGGYCCRAAGQTCLITSDCCPGSSCYCVGGSCGCSTP